VKRLNLYVQSLDAALYASVPKAVWAAIALSFAQRLAGDEAGFPAAVATALQEWHLLHANGLIPQGVPAALLARSRS
jgi:hypothetical protein